MVANGDAAADATFVSVALLVAAGVPFAVAKLAAAALVDAALASVELSCGGAGGASKLPSGAIELSLLLSEIDDTN